MSGDPLEQCPEARDWACETFHYRLRRGLQSLLLRWEPVPGVDKHDPINNSGTGGPVPPQARRGWCWGGMFLMPIWCLFNDLGWATFLAGLPLVNVIAALYLGYAGHGLVWQHRRFSSPEHFRAVMRTWDWAGLIAAAMWVAAFGLHGLFGR